jgi:hypothetical protein
MPPKALRGYFKIPQSQLIIPTAEEIGISKECKESYNIFVAKFMLKDKRSVSFVLDKKYKIMIKMGKIVVKERIEQGVETRIYRVGRLICKKTNWDKITVYINRSGNIYKKEQQFREKHTNPKLWLQITEYYKNGNKKAEYCVKWSPSAIYSSQKKIGESIDYDVSGTILRHTLYILPNTIEKITDENKKTLMIRHPVPFLQ